MTFPIITRRDALTFIAGEMECQGEILTQPDILFVSPVPLQTLRLSIPLLCRGASFCHRACAEEPQKVATALLPPPGLESSLYSYLERQGLEDLSCAVYHAGIYGLKILNRGYRMRGIFKKDNNTSSRSPRRWCQSEGDGWLRRAGLP